MKALPADADVFVLNVRGKAVERLGLDYDAVNAINPDILSAHCVGCGQADPYSELQAYDPDIQAHSATATRPPPPVGPPTPLSLPSPHAPTVTARPSPTLGNL